MLETIEQRLQTMEKSGELERIEEEAKARYRAYLERPNGFRLPRAESDRTYYIDPSITVPYDITDHTGRMIHRAGTTVHPLGSISLSTELLFFDGDDPAQVEWARSMTANDALNIKPILVNGPILTLINRWQSPVYFDQHGELSNRFRISAVPAVVSQDGEMLKIMEHKIKELE